MLIFYILVWSVWSVDKKFLCVLFRSTNVSVSNVTGSGHWHHDFQFLQLTVLQFLKRKNRFRILETRGLVPVFWDNANSHQALQFDSWQFVERHGWTRIFLKSHGNHVKQGTDTVSRSCFTLRGIALTLPPCRPPMALTYARFYHL